MISGAMFAQLNQADIPESQFSNVKSVKNAATNASNRVVIWSEDFAGGFPAGWTLQDASGICPWRFSTDGSWGNFNGNGATAGGTAIASTTAANGFLICDVDSANHFVYGQPSGTTYQYLDSYFTTDAIDLTGYPSVLLEFQQFFRFNNSVSLNVMVSTDNATWTTWTVQGATANNAASPNAEQVSVNISSVAGNQATVYIKIGWNARVYYWMIDDMQISEAADHDLKIANTSFNNQTPMSTGSTIKYTYIPTAQVAPIEFKADLVNFGAQSQTGCNANVDVVDIAMTNYYNGSGTAASLNPGDSLHATVAAFTPAATVRDYDIIYSLTYGNIGLDASLDNNTDTGWVKVTAQEYARDNNTFTGGGLWNGAGDPYVMGNTYQINSNWTVNTVRAAFSGGTAVGVVAYAEIYEIDGSGNFNLLTTSSGTSFEKTLTAADISSAAPIKWVDFQIDPTALVAGGEYIVCIGHYGGADDLTIMNGGTSQAQTTFMLDGTNATWYYLTSCPMIRLMNIPNISVTEIENSLGTLSQNIPNPADGNTIINYSLVESANVSFEVVDVTGKVIYAEALGMRSSGNNTLNFDTKSLSSGVYFYSVIINNEKLTKKMLVK